MKSLRKLDQKRSQHVRNEEALAQLTNLEVVHLWRDVKRGLSYMLASAPAINVEPRGGGNG